MSPPSAFPTPAQDTVSTPGAEVLPRMELIERRRMARPLPVPEVVELDEDSGWALWQATESAFSNLSH